MKIFVIHCDLKGFDFDFLSFPRKLAQIATLGKRQKFFSRRKSSILAQISRYQEIFSYHDSEHLGVFQSKFLKTRVFIFSPWLSITEGEKSALALIVAAKPTSSYIHSTNFEYTF